jgi:CubicO group peptidase (beta-lactamase class C family)
VQLVQERVLTPIGMNSTTFDIDEALTDTDHAWPHSYNGDHGAIVQAPIGVEKFVESVTPAGGAWSSLRDMAAYASTQLSGVAPNPVETSRPVPVAALSCRSTHPSPGALSRGFRFRPLGGCARGSTLPG